MELKTFKYIQNEELLEVLYKEPFWNLWNKEMYLGVEFKSRRISGHRVDLRKGRLVKGKPENDYEIPYLCFNENGYWIARPQGHKKYLSTISSQAD